MPSDVVHLDEVKARAFLRTLLAQPFVTVMSVDGVLRVYTKGLEDLEARALLVEVLAQMDSP